MDPSDSQLLEEFVREKSDRAFGLLAGRYVNLVHAAARRQVRDANLADDVTQAVFIVLARRAASVSPHCLAGWLLTTTRFCARDAMKVAARRVHHEQEAAMSRSELEAGGAPEAEQHEICPLLDEALARLRERERTALALRFLQDRPVGEVAAAMGMSVNTMQKVISRALPKLRRMLANKGIIVATTAVLSEALMREAVHAAPAQLVGPVSEASTQSLSIAKGAMNMMRWTRIKLAATIAAAVLLTGGAGAVVLNRGMAANVVPAAPAAVAAGATSNLMGFNSPFLELVGCQIKQKIDLNLTTSERAAEKVSWAEQQYPQIGWTSEAGTEAKVSGYSVSIARKDNPGAARRVAADKSAHEINDGPTEPGEYVVKVTANGADGKPVGQAAVDVSVKPLPIMQIQIDDVQADGSIRFTTVEQQMNETSKDFTNGALSYSDMYHITAMTDEQGVPVQFTMHHKGSTQVFWFKLNRAVEPGEVIMGSTSGTVTDLIQKMSDGSYSYSFDHSPGANVVVRRIELYRLPAGATVVRTVPQDLPSKMVDGQMQVFVDTIISAGGHNAVTIQYRLGEGK